ncbi:afadin- and alpha-actinin-binding protein B isoform X2 [Perca flavescens]|uniref:afadin- and alpha-actinin-binding protein B isoform X2 n=2 Tax=Perca flavescens TaxID=8167 RepID=UPI00106EF6CC|nr:afadin- and alpha-actinin-binding protein B-like isoform X2 [Perca flavescens]
MASRLSQKRLGKRSESSDSFLLRDPSPSPLNELSHSASWWADREEHREQGDSLREQLKEMGEHVARLQDMLRCERAKCTRLQLRCNQQEVEVRRREQHTNRLKERVSQLTDRHNIKGPSIEALNLAPGGRGKREQPIKSFRSTAKREEETLRLMLERREAELREAMKLRHSIATLFHALRVDMEHTLSDGVDVQNEAQAEDSRLDQAEVALGDHVTGGVVQCWRQVQRRLGGGGPSEGHAGVDTDHDKLLAQLETELKESQQLVRLQQQLLQRRDFEQQKASVLKQQYLLESPLSGKGAPSHNRRESTGLDFSSLGPTGISCCLPITPSSTKSGTAAVSGSHQRRVRVQTPSTPELYSALNLSYNCREFDDQSETWEGRADTRQAPHLDWSFDYNCDDRW